MRGDRTRRALALSWLLLVLAATGYAGWVFFSRGLPVQTDLLSLLPREDRNPVTLGAKDAMTAAVSQRVLLLVGHSNRAVAKSAATLIRDGLTGAGLILPAGDVPAARALKQLGATYFPHRAGLLAAADRRRLSEGRADEIVNRALAQIFGFGGIAGGGLLAKDPFLLFPAFLADLPVPASRLTMDGEWPGVSEGGRSWVLVTGRLAGAPTALGFQRRFMSTFTATLARLTQDQPELTVLRLGALFFAQAGAEQAAAETSLIGSVSLIGTALLIILGFRAVTPLVLGVAAIAIGLIVALSACLLLFGELHVAAQLFGASLIGIAADYAVLYFGQIFSPGVAPGARLARVLPGITLGMATTVAGYATLALSPFPGLRQVAAFSAIGLIASFTTVIVWFPLLDRTEPARLDAVSRRLAGRLWGFWNDAATARHRRAVLALALLGGLAGAARLGCDDDVRHQQALSATLLAEQAEVQRLTGFGQSLQFFLVEAGDTEQALQREEALGERLAAASRRGELSGWQAPARFVPSAARQQADRRLVEEALIRPHLAAFRERLGLIGAEPETVVPVPVSLPDILATGALPLLEATVLPPLSGRVVHVVTLEGVRDASRLRQSAEGLDGVQLIDPTGDLSALLAAYRQRAVALLVASVGFMVPLLALRYGWGGALRLMVPPVLATALTPLLLALAGLPFSFFAAMALVLVLSIAVDYAVFCAENRDPRDGVTLYSVALAMAATMLSFGLMAVSGTVAIRSFGAAMAAGVAIAYLLSPMAGGVRPRNKE